MVVVAVAQEETARLLLLHSRQLRNPELLLSYSMGLRRLQLLVVFPLQTLSPLQALRPLQALSPLPALSLSSLVLQLLSLRQLFSALQLFHPLGHLPVVLDYRGQPVLLLLELHSRLGGSWRFWLQL